MASQKQDLVRKEYRAKLAQLKMNDKLIINDLTRKAHEHIGFCPVIVRLVEDRIRAVRPQQQLYSLNFL